MFSEKKKTQCRDNFTVAMVKGRHLQVNVKTMAAFPLYLKKIYFQFNNYKLISILFCFG